MQASFPCLQEVSKCNCVQITVTGDVLVEHLLREVFAAMSGGGGGVGGGGGGGGGGAGCSSIGSTRPVQSRVSGLAVGST